MKAFLPVKDFVADQFIVMVTKHGVIKKCELTEFDNPMSRGIIAVSLDEGDELLAAKHHATATTSSSSARTKAWRSASRKSEVRAMGRQARGVRAMDLDEGDYLVGMEVVEKDGLILSISENGFGKRTPLERLPADAPRRQGRHQHEDHQQDRQGGGDSLGEGRYRPDDHQQERQDHPHRIVARSGRPAAPRKACKLVSLEEGDKVAAASVIPEAESPDNEQETLPLQ